MIDILLHRHAPCAPARYMRVEITDNLFGEYSLLQECGASGPLGHRVQRVAWYGNLREACRAAEALRLGALRAGYALTAASPEPVRLPRAQRIPFSASSTEIPSASSPSSR